MQHTIAAVFDKQSQAQQALDDLLDSGFLRDDVRLSQSETTSPTGQASTDKRADDESFGSRIRSFFSEIFGTDSSDDAELYSEAVLRGNYVLTVNVPDDDMVDRATDVLDRYDPLDIDEQASNWKSGGLAAPESVRQNAGAEQQSETGSNAIPVIREELKVGKRAVQRGGVRVFQRVVEKPVEESIDLREERVTVERRPVNQPSSQADLTAFKESSFELRETAEEPVVEKVARVVEEVVVGKEVKQRQERISDKLRSTEVEVEQLSASSGQSAGMDDDAYFRSHWNSNYSSSGDSYEDYAPAYRYGSTLAGSGRYKGRRWDDMESDVRSDWEAKNPGSAWGKVKNAVRHGWERMTK
jgi:uncharacterized protein (TIGR02271 family)